MFSILISVISLKLLYCFFKKQELGLIVNDFSEKSFFTKISNKFNYAIIFPILNLMLSILSIYVLADKLDFDIYTEGYDTKLKKMFLITNT